MDEIQGQPTRVAIALVPFQTRGGADVSIRTQWLQRLGDLPFSGVSSDYAPTLFDGTMSRHVADAQFSSESSAFWSAARAGKQPQAGHGHALATSLS